MISEFDSALNAYECWLSSEGFESDRLRVEVHVESLKDWSLKGSLADVKEWFLTQQSICKMQIMDIPLNECRGWKVSDEGNICHDSGDFFVVQGVRVNLTENREVATGWDQPIVTQVGYDGGVLGLLRQRINGVPHYLIEAKAEPGNPDKVQISPTLQATFANIKQAHGGKRPRFCEYFVEEMRKKDCQISVLFDQWMSEDGGRLHLKRNKGMLVEVPENTIVDLPSTYRWMSMFQLKQLIKENSWVNPHIRGILSSL